MVIHSLNLQSILFFEQQHQLQLFVRTGCFNVITVGNVLISGINVMDGHVAMMVAMNGIVVRIVIICYDENIFKLDILMWKYVN